MTQERWKALMTDDDLKLTAEEIATGWHFCVEWDGLLIGPRMQELDCCECLKSRSQIRSQPALIQKTTTTDP